MSNQNSGVKSTNDSDEEQPQSYIDDSVGGDGYTEIKVQADSDTIEGLAHGSATTYEFTGDGGEIVAVVVEGEGDLDRDWLLGETDDPQPPVRKTIAAIGLFGLATAAPHATGFGFLATMLSGVVGVIAGIWIIDAVRSGYLNQQESSV
jgi:hypothetical protein